jgi:MFS family permease
VAGPRAIISALGVVVRNGEIRRIEVAWGAAIGAEWGHFVALGVFAYQRGGAPAVGIAGLVRLLPAAFIAPVATTFADRFRRERFLLLAVMVGAFALAGSAAAAAAGLAVVVYALAAVVGISSTLIRPTLQALLPSLARTPAELIAANGTSSTIESIGTLAGPLLAGILVSFASVGVAFAVWSGVVLAAAVLLTRVHVEGETAHREPLSGETAVQTFALGLSVVARDPATRLVAGLIAAQTFVRGCLNVLIVVAAFRVLHHGAGAVGYLTAAIGCGGLFGALSALTLKPRRLGNVFALSLASWGLPIALIAPHPVLAIALVLLAITGAANSIEDVAGFTLLQRTIPDDVLGRSLGLVWGLAMGGVALGSLAAPGIVRAVGPRAAFLLVGSILPLLSLTTYRRLVALDYSTRPTDLLELVDHVPMLAPLSIATKERLARQLVSFQAPAGECVIRAGEIGDRFYILERGTLDTNIDGLHKQMHAPDSFGEIALLRDTRRTATVTAVTDSRLHALYRDDFIAAVTGSRAAQTAGHAVVEARLADHPTTRQASLP